MADSKPEPLGGLNPNIPFLFSQIREEMYTQAPHEGAWLHCEFTVNSKEGEEPILIFEYDNPQKVPGLISDKDKLNAEFQQFPRSESFTPLWWQTMLDKPIAYIPLRGEEDEEDKEDIQEEEVDSTPAEPVIQRSQTWQTDEIRNKLLLLQNHILAPLTQGGYGPASGTWEKCTIYGYPLTQRGVVMLDMADGKQEYLDLHPNTSMGLGRMFHQIREEMYKQAPYEGAWLTCEYIIRSEDVDSPAVMLEYDKEDAFTGGISDKKKVCGEFRQFPRGKYFTPVWWQEILDETTEYLPVPDGVVPDPNAGVLDCIEELRKNLQQDAEGVLHLPERMRLYQQIGDPDIVNKIFLECAKKVFPVWLERFPEDKKLPELLLTIHAYLYNATDQREQATQKPVDKKVIRNAYKELVSICMPGYENTEKLNRFIDSVDIDPDNPEEAFNAIYDYLDEEDKYFFIFLDYKLEIEDIEWNIKTVLEENFNVSLSLPDTEQYSDCTSLHEVYEIFEDYKTALNAGGYDLIQLDINADSYVLVVYPLVQQKQVRNSIANTGLSIWNNNYKEKNEINFYHLQINALYHISSLRFQTDLGNDPCFEAARALSAVSFNIYSEAGGCNGVLNPEVNRGQDDCDLDREILSPDYIAFLVATNNMKEAGVNREYWSWFLDTVVNLVNDPDFSTPIGAVTKKRRVQQTGYLITLMN